MTPKEHGRKAETLASGSAVAEKKSGNTCGVGGDARLCLSTQWTEEENEEEFEELSFIPGAVSEPRWALYRCDNNWRGGLQVPPTDGHCDRRRNSSYDQLVQAVLQCKAG